MTNATILITLVFSVLILSRKQLGTGLGLVIMSMLIWPEYLRVPFGLAEMSVPRITALFLLVKIFMMGRHRRVEYGAVDKIVVLVWVWTLFANVMADASSSQMTQMIGRFFDTVLMYFIARLSLTSIEDMKATYVPLAITALIMGGLGAYEAITTYSPYSNMISYRSWSWINKPPESRYGFMRAQASTSVPIFFGMAMMLLAGWLWALKGYVNNIFFHFVVVLAAILASLSSMSSGPWIACFMLIILRFYQGREKLIKPSLYALIFLAILLEVISNRHFYNLIDYIALNSQTAWYRTRLLEIGVANLHEYWLFGVGSEWPHHWAKQLDGRGHIDIVNHFLIVALQAGLPGMFLYICMHYLALKHTIGIWKNSQEAAQKKLIFMLAITLIALDASSMSVGLFGPPLLMSYLLIGAIMSHSSIKVVDDMPVEGDIFNEWKKG